jgi:hypothetical protein
MKPDDCYLFPEPFVSTLSAGAAVELIRNCIVTAKQQDGGAEPAAFSKVDYAQDLVVQAVDRLRDLDEPIPKDLMAAISSTDWRTDGHDRRHAGGDAVWRT